MRKLKSDLLFTLTRNPIKNGIVSVQNDGTIISIEPSNVCGSEIGVEFYPGAICPGFINAHCHLELSYSRSQIEPHNGINSFIDELEKQKRITPIDEKYSAIAEAEQEMLNNGIVAVGDICNSTDSLEIKKNSLLKYYNFIEVFGSLETKAESNFSKGLEVFNQMNEPKSIVLHAPYSVSESLMKMNFDFAENKNKVQSMHHLESKEELNYFLSASGAIAERLQKWGIEIPKHIPSKKSPFKSIEKFIDKDNILLLVHNTFLEEEELKAIQSSHPKTYFVLCPISNYYIENCQPNYLLFLQHPNKICIGTDSLASNYFLSILDEIKWIQTEYPEIKSEFLLQWACKNGAEALGFHELGTIEKGKRPGLVHLSDFDLENCRFGKHSMATRII